METTLRKVFRRGLAGGRVLSAFVALTLVMTLAAPGLAALAADGADPESAQGASVEASVSPDAGASEQGAPQSSGLIPAAITPQKSGPNWKLEPLEGWRHSGGWTNGQIKTYHEGEWVSFREVISNVGDEDGYLPASLIGFSYYRPGAGNGIGYDYARGIKYYVVPSMADIQTSQFPTGALEVPGRTEDPTPYLVSGAYAKHIDIGEGGIMVPAGSTVVIYFELHTAITAYYQQHPVTVGGETVSRGASYFPGGGTLHGWFEVSGEGAKTLPNDVGPATGASISLFKYLETNNVAGYQAADEDPLAGRQFTLTAQGPWPFSFTATSGADGMVVFDNLPTGTYVLDEVADPNYALAPAGSLPMTIELADGEVYPLITIGNVALTPEITVTKTANPTSVSELGGPVEFTVTVENTGMRTVTLTGVVDSVFGPLNVADFSKTTLAVGETATMEFTRTLSGQPTTTHHNTVTVTAIDSAQTQVSGSDDATVTFTDVMPAIEVEKEVTPLSMAEPGGLFSYTVRVKNTSAERIRLTSVVDDKYGVLLSVADPEVWLLPNAVKVFTFTMSHTQAGEYTNTVTAYAMDDDSNSVSGTASATATVTDVRPDVVLTKTVDASSKQGPDATFTFTLTIRNNGVEAFEITSLTDTNLSTPLPAAVAALIGTTVAPGDQVSASYPVTHASAGTYPNTAVVVVQDNEGSTDTDTDTETVTVTARQVTPPDVVLTKTVDVATLQAPDAVFTFTLSIRNQGTEAFTITSLTDTNLAEPYPAAVAALVGTTIPAGGQVSVSYPVTHATAGTYPNTATVVVENEDGLTDTDTDTETVVVEPFLPFTEMDLLVTKVADKETAAPGELITYTLTYWNVGDLAAEDFTIVDDFDERYVTVVSASGGVVADGKITWSIAGPLAAADGKKTITYTVRVNAAMPVGTTNVDNVVVITDPDDADTTNNTAVERVTVTVAPVTPVEPFLPFTGGDYVGLLLAAMASAVLGLALRRNTRPQEA